MQSITKGPLNPLTILLVCLGAGVAGGIAGGVVGFLGSITLICARNHSGDCGLAGVFLAAPLAAVGAVIGVLWAAVLIYRRRHPSFTKLDASLIVGVSGGGGVLGGFAPIIGSPVCFLGICGLSTFYVTAAAGFTLGLVMAGGVVFRWRKRFRPA